MTKPITIVGGGLAGLTLGVALRQREAPVSLWETGHYPRHRVCGEFISGAGQDALTRLGLIQLLEREGAIPARTVEFCSKGLAGRARPLPRPALCLPRREMDAALARHFKERGGDLREGARWRDETDRQGVVVASGRKLNPLAGGWRWFGLKAHATRVATAADLEMHMLDGGYVGLCRQPGNVVNVCGLFRRRGGGGQPIEQWQDQMRGPAGSLLRERMHDAQFVPESFCAVAGIDLTPRRALRQRECRIGDALTMIPPFTGNGMSMAFESAEMAVEPLTAWSRGEASWEEARLAIGRRCDAAFARRLAWAKWLQRMILSPALRDMLVGLTSRSDWLWRIAFERTR